jgi:hypothetical protein
MSQYEIESKGGDENCVYECRKGNGEASNLLGREGRRRKKMQDCSAQEFPCEARQEHHMHVSQRHGIAQKIKHVALCITVICRTKQMWRWPCQSLESSASMMENLEKVCGQGKRFSFLISTAREVSTTSSKTTPKTILVNLMTDAVLVTNNNPLVIGLDGEKMFLHRFKVLKTDVQIAFEGLLGVA